MTQVQLNNGMIVTRFSDGYVIVDGVKMKVYKRGGVWHYARPKNLHANVSMGNSKIGKIPNFNLTPGTSCSRVACETCHAGKMLDGTECAQCYACKAYKQYPNVRKAWDANTDMVLCDLDLFEREMNAFLTWYETSTAAEKAGYRFRLHSAGDFITLDYMRVWYRLMKKHPGINFLFFTKQYEMLEKVDFLSLSNVGPNASGGFGLESIIPENIKNTYSVAYVLDHLPKAEREKVLKTCTVCPGSCVNCAACWNTHKTGLNIGFMSH